MKTIHRIFGRLNIAAVRFSDAGNFGVTYYHCAYGRQGLSTEEKSPKYDQVLLTKYPTVILMAGYGVITKDFDEGSDTVREVISSPQKFTCSFSTDREKISFVRTQQAQAVYRHIEEAGISCIDTVCCSISEFEREGYPEEALTNVYREKITIRNTLTPGRRRSVLSMYLFDRLKFPVLGLVLLALVINFMAGRSINSRQADARMELMALQRNAGKAESDSKLLRRTIEEFNRSLPYTYAELSDRIGSAVPAGVILTQIAISPLRKAIENGKEPQPAGREIVIRGEATGPADISSLIDALNMSGFASDIKLSSVERNKAGSLSVFQINIGI